ncbi:hypothetical protein II906_01900 [bacterium]|nr:hypothetical protein [bacterium]
MSRSSIRYINTSYIYGQHAVAAPVSNPVIYGRFPKFNTKTSNSLEKINKALTACLMGLVMLSLVSYYFVSDTEKSMNNLGREIVALTNENIELQNKLDNLHSFNRVDAIIHGNTSLDIAKDVIELPAVQVASIPTVDSVPANYNWSMGY